MYAFTPDQVTKIKQLGMCSSVGAMQGDVAPPPGTELSMDAFEACYEEQARYAAKTFYNDESKWSMLAQVWAATDIDIVRDALWLGECHRKSREQVLHELFGWPLPESTTTA